MIRFVPMTNPFSNRKSVVRMLSAFARGGTLLGRTWRCAGGLLPHYRQERREVGSSIDQPVGNGVSAQTKDSQKSLPVAPSPEECCGTGCSDCTYLKCVPHHKSMQFSIAKQSCSTKLRVITVQNTVTVIDFRLYLFPLPLQRTCTVKHD